eukprot:TRINITY_DN11506_c0_g1_i1.p1 TRINITY_DN11506_c0_g1~~TRINITY_DN11506_c0_g1_i1.p1  ORF type:complete len:584 (-),score=99.64 TRINITY_DN11506_c0_g1_i1:108-1859(-)
MAFQRLPSWRAVLLLLSALNLSNATSLITVAGSEGLTRPITENGAISKLTIFKGYTEYFSFTAPAGMAISIAAVPCSGRFDTWARVGGSVPVTRADTDLYLTHSALMSQIIRKGRFFAFRVPPSTFSTTVVVAIRAAYGVDTKLELILEYDLARTTLPELDLKFFAPVLVEERTEFFTDETAAERALDDDNLGNDQVFNSTVWRGITAAVLPPGAAVLDWKMNLGENFTVYSIDPALLAQSSTAVVETACGLQEAALDPSELVTAAVFSQGPFPPMDVAPPDSLSARFFVGNLIKGKRYQFAVVADDSLRAPAALQMSASLLMPTLEPGTGCKAYTSTGTDDPCPMVSWKISGGSDTPLLREAASAMIDRYNASNYRTCAAATTTTACSAAQYCAWDTASSACVPSLAASCKESWRNWVCGQTFRLCVERTFETIDGKEKLEKGDMDCGGYLAPCLSTCEAVGSSSCPALYKQDCNSLYGLYPDPAPVAPSLLAYKNKVDDFVSTSTAGKCCNTNVVDGKTTREACFGSSKRDGGTEGPFNNPRAVLTCEVITAGGSRIAGDCFNWVMVLGALLLGLEPWKML